jgi:hypothetical protein
VLVEDSNSLFEESMNFEIEIEDNYLSGLSAPIANQLATDPARRFHYTRTHASRLNQIEIWFSILAKQSLEGQSFGSGLELAKQMTEKGRCDRAFCGS